MMVLHRGEGDHLMEVEKALEESGVLYKVLISMLRVTRTGLGDTCTTGSNMEVVSLFGPAT